MEIQRVRSNQAGHIAVGVILIRDDTQLPGTECRINPIELPTAHTSDSGQFSAAGKIWIRRDHEPEFILVQTIDLGIEKFSHRGIFPFFSVVTVREVPDVLEIESPIRPLLKCSAKRSIGIHIQQ